ncbi:hypothetical protein M0R89_16975 [Halorussus limi]|uniref:Cell division protein A N-terminal domain-containing protein n=1 Tax=Halorussus limi TaxID=2938695 RepID=A0A8U0HTP1_9EURY|nr:hypothetical protein [Halorussus limi]UPV74219.1 hypothetical protein M0R89_16975 [Halorussus limi]
MSGSEADEEALWRTVGRAVLLLAGGLVAVVGFVAATASLVAGFGVGKATSLRLGVLLGAVFLLACFLALFRRTPDADRSRSLAGVGTAVAVAGVALFWTAGWTGRPGELPPVAAGAYAVGLLAVFGAGFPSDLRDVCGTCDRGETDTFGRGVESVVTAADGDREFDGGHDRSDAGGERTETGESRAEVDESRSGSETDRGRSGRGERS